MARTFRRLSGWQKDERKVLNNPRALYHRATVSWSSAFWSEFLDNPEAVKRQLSIMQSDNGKSYHWFYKKQANRRLRNYQNRTLRQWIAVGDIEDDTIIPQSRHDAQFWD